MSTHALGNVQLITVQEVEAMLDGVVIPEASIDTKVDAKVAAETAAREAADTALTEKITAVKQMEEASDSNFSFTRFKDLPIAVLNVDTSSLTFKFSELGKTLVTVPNRYLPKYSVDFVTSAHFLLDIDSSGTSRPEDGIDSNGTSRPEDGIDSSGTSSPEGVLNGICPIVLNLDINGNIKFVNALPMDSTGYNVVNTGNASVTYITKE